ncbi:MAG: response regulator [Verrucomicrobiae bacterium]|nr:response regulator [Verrucomicrobiae bacterium]
MSSQRILCVDDDPNILAGYQRALRKSFPIETASGGEEALRLFEAQGPYGVIVADMQMPGLSGIELLSMVADRYPDTVRLMLTGNGEQRTAAEAVNQGRIFRFLTKPCAAETLEEALRAAIQQHRLVRAERELLENTLHGSVKTLTEILSMVDPASFGLGQVLREEVRRFLESLGRPSYWEYEIAAMLSQIGFVTIPQPVIKRMREGHGLGGDERRMIERVPQVGADLLAPIPRLEGVARAILYQRKNYDGGGFPIDDVAGEEIPLGARILRVLLDLHEAESRGLARGNGLLLLREREGLYDPRVLEAMARCFHAPLPTEATGPVETRLLRLRDLEPGQVLATQVETQDGTLLVPAGRTLTPVIIEKIRNFATIAGIREPIAVET